MRVLICGDRNWTDPWKIAGRIDQLPPDAEVIHGAARGADTFAGAYAESRGLTVHAFPAQWRRYGRGAGPIRNQLMLDQKPDLVIAFHHDLEQSRGTKDMVTRARKAGIETEVIS